MPSSRQGEFSRVQHRTHVMAVLSVQGCVAEEGREDLASNGEFVSTGGERSATGSLMGQ
jgi:hypothetical protein